jgi:orotidine-5'-phosphate decarboxylase
VSELVSRKAGQAKDIGIDGIVASAAEASNIRRIVGPGTLIVTPGIRPAGSASGDQKRVVTPGDAIKAGADYLVVGRPVTGAADPVQAAEALVGEIASALK